MKKLLILLSILIISMAMFVSCEENTPTEKNPDDTNQMQYIGSSKISNNNVPSNVNGPAEEIQYYLDNKTEIVYMAVINHVGDKSWAGFTPLIDSDGTYTTYDEYLERFNLNQ
jgi:glycerol-3-phosphate dehydrogenase